MTMGYGIVEDDLKWRDDADQILVDRYVRTGELADDYLEYCQENDLDVDSLEAKEEYVADYENTTFFWAGREGLLTDVINNERFGNEVIFRNEDYAIYVEAYIPVDEDDRAKYPTQIEIQKILAEYLQGLTTEPATFEWLTIHD